MSAGDGKCHIIFETQTTLTLLRIHSGTLYNARAACKMVCVTRKGKYFLPLDKNPILPDQTEATPVRFFLLRAGI